MFSLESDRPARRSRRRASRFGPEVHENNGFNHGDGTTNAPTNPTQDKAICDQRLAGLETAPPQYDPDHSSRSRSADHAASGGKERFRVGPEKRRVTGPCKGRHALLRFLVLANMAVVIRAWFCVGSYYQSNVNNSSWVGDPRVNIPIWNLHPEDLDVVAVPFPMADVVTKAEVYTNACFDIRLPRRTFNITLRLDVPGLARVNVPSSLPGS